MIFGDSITYGVGDVEIGGWVNRLRLHYDDKYDYDCRIFNMGIPGEITEETLKRFEHECEFRYNKEQKNIIIFAVGINDTQDISGSDRVSLEKFESNIRELITKTRSYLADILFIGLTNVDESKVVPIPWNPVKSYFNEKIIKYDNKMEEICKGENVLYIKMHDCFSVNELYDGLHPTNEGHKKMYDRILKEIDIVINKN